MRLIDKDRLLREANMESQEIEDDETVNEQFKSGYGKGWADAIRLILISKEIEVEETPR